MNDCDMESITYIEKKVLFFSVQPKLCPLRE